MTRELEEEEKRVAKSTATLLAFLVRKSIIFETRFCSFRHF